MSLPSRTGSPAGPTAAGTLVALSFLAIALIPRLALAQMTGGDALITRSET